MREAHFVPRDAEFLEFAWRHVADDGQMLGRRPQILPQGEDADLVEAQIAHHLQHLLGRLSQAEHQAGFRRGLRLHAAGMLQHLERALVARPDVLNHNTETVPRLYRQVRLGARYERSLEVLQHARRVQPETPTKSGLMLGLGENAEEVLQVMRDLRAHRVSIRTLGQYLRPAPKHLPIVRYVSPAEFQEFRIAGNQMGFAHVESGPLVRSSYHASNAVVA